ncbi:MAG TPA: hypothetical protein VFA10_21205, partial [Ktedonobacteraceae bacterium]|nr:hypothetical protein [Ktedonobacteraceae bacterium]
AEEEDRLHAFYDSRTGAKSTGRTLLPFLLSSSAINAGRKHIYQERSTGCGPDGCAIRPTAC